MPKNKDELLAAMGAGKAAADSRVDAMKKDNSYDMWGDQAAVAKEQGWYPEINFGNEIHYKSKYDNAFNKVIVPGQQNGYIGVIGYPNNKMDVVIKDAKGNVIRTVVKQGSPQDVQNYTKKLVISRDESIRNGTNPDKLQADGSYTTL
jgi:hypothetical protein